MNPMGLIRELIEGKGMRDRDLVFLMICNFSGFFIITIQFLGKKLITQRIFNVKLI